MEVILINSLKCFTKKVKQNNCQDKIDHDQYGNRNTQNQTMTILYARKNIIPSNNTPKLK